MIKKFSFLIGILMFGLHQGQQKKNNCKNRMPNLKTNCTNKYGFS